jgi:high-affinity iron transporter
MGMLLNAVILILQETLEAALLISVLAAMCSMRRQRFGWLALGMLGGVILASIYAAKLQVVSEWFDYVGQEVVNALLQGLIAFLIVIFFCLISPRRDQKPGLESRPGKGSSGQPGLMVAAAIIMLAITREGSEIVLYLGGLMQQQEHLQAVLMGAILGFGIGLSIGFLLFYGLMGLRSGWGERAATFLLALFAGNMLAQAVMQLTQADWIPATQPLWDSSNWLPEQSIFGQLLYALVGYESTPSLWHVLAYLVGFGAVIVVVMLIRPKIKPAGTAPSAGA